MNGVRFGRVGAGALTVLLVTGASASADDDSASRSKPPITAGRRARTAPACALLRPVARAALGRTAEKSLDLNGSSESQVPPPGSTLVASQCEFVADDDRVVGLGVVTFVTPGAAGDGFARSRLDVQFDKTKFEIVEGLGVPSKESDAGIVPVLTPAYWLPKTPNHSRTAGGKTFAFGELVVLDGRRIYNVWTSPSTRREAERTMKRVLTA